MPRKRRRIRELLGEIQRLWRLVVEERRTAAALRSECIIARRESAVSKRWMEFKEERNREIWSEKSVLEDEVSRLAHALNKQSRTMTLGDFCHGWYGSLRGGGCWQYQRDTSGFLIMVWNP